MTSGEVEVLVLEDACAASGGRERRSRRRKRQGQVQTVDVPRAVMEKAVLQSIQRFYDVSIYIQFLKLYLITGGQQVDRSILHQGHDS